MNKSFVLIAATSIATPAAAQGSVLYEHVVATGDLVDFDGGVAEVTGVDPSTAAIDDQGRV